jgi:AbrB family looped-hinge helix DNA binding protein
MIYSSQLTSKGQVTIPKDVRIRLGLKEGERVEFVTEGERTIIRPAQNAANPFAKYAGILGNFPGGIPEINKSIAELRDDE